MAEPGISPQPDSELTEAELMVIAQGLDLAPIPPHLAAPVLAAVQSYRASMRRLDAAGIDLAEVVTAQPLRAGEMGRRP